MGSSIVKSVAQQLGKLSVNEVKYLYNVNNKIESLKNELEYMHCFLKDAESLPCQDHLTRQRVCDIRDFAYEAEDIVEMYLQEVSHPRSEDGIWNTLTWFCHILDICEAWTLHNLGSKLDKLKEEVTNRKKWAQTYGINPAVRTDNDDHDRRQTYSNNEHLQVVGLKKDVREVVDKLVTTQVNVVGISGTGGLGKTTLAQKVFSHETIKQHFGYNNCVWVYVSRQVDKTRVFRDILFGLNKSEDSRNKIKGLGNSELPDSIYEILKERKCLVVLDDIWTVDAWRKISEPAFTSIEKSCSKILITTRDQNLLQCVDRLRRYSHPLEPLSPEDSWKLLQIKAFRNEEIAGSSDKERASTSQQITMENAMGNDKVACSDDELVKPDQMDKLGRKMLEHLDGLPIAIVALGGILSTKKTLYEWENVEKNISFYLRYDVDHRGTNSQMLEVIELSYYDLPFYLKPCFLYLGNFPEDYNISTQRLYQLWEAEGFLLREGGTTYDVGERYLNELVRRSIVEVGECLDSGKIKTCKVHDVIRDICLKKCEEMNYLNTIECSRSDMESMLAACSGENKKVRRCAIHGKYKVVDKQARQHRQKADKHLRSLLVFLLAYHGHSTKSTNIASPNIWKSFPLLRVLDLEGTRNICSIGGVEHLVLLRYLRLRNTDVTEVPSCIYDLKYLETLDLRCNWRKMTLRNKFHEMERLRHLYLPAGFGVDQGGEKLSFLPQMETLKNFNTRECETEGLMQMTNIRVFSMKGLYCLNAKEVLDRVLKAPFMKTPGQLINSFRLRVHGHLVREFPRILSSAIGHPNLKKFSMSGPSVSLVDVDFGMGDWGNVFANTLEWVELWECEIGGTGLLALENLPRLKELRLHGGVILGRRITFSARSFAQLNRLHLNWQHEMEEWEVGEGAIPNLQSLEIVQCSKLRSLPNGIPDSVYIDCKPCIRGIERYNTCPHFKAEAKDNYVN